MPLTVRSGARNCVSGALYVQKSAAVSQVDVHSSVALLQVHEEGSSVNITSAFAKEVRDSCCGLHIFVVEALLMFCSPDRSGRPSVCRCLISLQASKPILRLFHLNRLHLLTQQN